MSVVDDSGVFVSKPVAQQERVQQAWAQPGAKRDLPLSQDDETRSNVVHSYSLQTLDTNATENLQSIVDLAAKVFPEVDAICINIVARDSQFYVATHQIPVRAAFPRIGSLCNFVVAMQDMFVCPDLDADDDLKVLPARQWGFRFYAGAPLVDDDGFALGSMACVSKAPQTNFTVEKAETLNHFARLAIGVFRSHRLAMQVKQAARLSAQALNGTRDRALLGPPKVNMTLMFSDIENSTALWERHPLVMDEATKLHDNLFRQSLPNFCGYEVTTEGDAFQVAFHSARDAVSFCLHIQEELLKVSWPEELLQDPLAREETDADGTVIYRGLRVRMGLHCGTCDFVATDPVTQRLTYVGQVTQNTKLVCDAANGGQVLCSAEVWSEYCEGGVDPAMVQVIDQGVHVLKQDNPLSRPGSILLRAGRHLKPKVTSFHLMEVLPASLAIALRGSDPKDGGLPANNVGHDGHEQHKHEHEHEHGTQGHEAIGDHQHLPLPPCTVTGRRNAPVRSLQKKAQSFWDAPLHPGKPVFVCFLMVKNMNKIGATQSAQLMAQFLTSTVRSTLKRFGGYECQEDLASSFMLLFPDATSGLRWALSFLELPNQLEDFETFSPSLEKVVRLAFKIGLFLGEAVDLRPHGRTGRADVFGPVVNRAARVAAAAPDSSVAMDQTWIDSCDKALIESLTLDDLGDLDLKGVEGKVRLWSVTRSAVEEENEEGATRSSDDEAAAQQEIQQLPLAAANKAGSGGGVAAVAAAPCMELLEENVVVEGKNDEVRRVLQLQQRLGAAAGEEGSNGGKDGGRCKQHQQAAAAATGSTTPAAVTSEV